MTEDLIRYVSIPRELVPFEERTGSYFGVPALLSLTKATFNDQELNMPFPNGMGMSSPFVVAALTQCPFFPISCSFVPGYNAIANPQHDTRASLHKNVSIKKKSLMSFRFSFLCWQGTWRAQLFVGSDVVHSTLKRLISV